MFLNVFIYSGVLSRFNSFWCNSGIVIFRWPSRGYGQNIKYWRQYHHWPKRCFAYDMFLFIKFIGQHIRYATSFCSLVILSRMLHVFVMACQSLRKQLILISRQNHSKEWARQDRTKPKTTIYSFVLIFVL
jgi:hypothetical protein